MKSITMTVFINEWLPEHLKNKIFHYACDCHNFKNTSRNHAFKIGGIRYSINSTDYLGNFIPFRDDGFNREINSKGKCVSFLKKMKTFVTKADILKMKSIGKLELKQPNGRVIIIESKHLDLKYIQYFEYTNLTELENFTYGLYLREVEALWVYHIPYNNGASRRYILYNTVSPPIVIAISPLQMLWRINHGLVSIETLKELSRINQINGRSKLKTRKDFIIAFMKL